MGNDGRRYGYFLGHSLYPGFSPWRTHGLRSSDIRGIRPHTGESHHGGNSPGCQSPDAQPVMVGGVTVSAEPDDGGFVGSAPKGLGRLATGGAKRNPWMRSAAPQLFALKGRRHAAPALSGRRNEAARIPPTGSAALHPWPCACAPPELNARAPDAGTADGAPPILSRTLIRVA